MFRALIISKLWKILWTELRPDIDLYLNCKARCQPYLIAAVGVGYNLFKEDSSKFRSRLYFDYIIIFKIKEIENKKLRGRKYFHHYVLRRSNQLIITERVILATASFPAWFRATWWRTHTPLAWRHHWHHQFPCSSKGGNLHHSVVVWRSSENQEIWCLDEVWQTIWKQIRHV